MRAVADSSALIALAVCECLPVLDDLFESVVVPPAENAEVQVEGKPGADMLGNFLRNRVHDIDLGRYVIAALGLGRGELEAMALYKELNAAVRASSFCTPDALSGADGVS